jgi:hypothetical protein
MFGSSRQGFGSGVVNDVCLNVSSSTDHSLSAYLIFICALIIQLRMTCVTSWSQRILCVTRGHNGYLFLVEKSEFGLLTGET